MHSTAQPASNLLTTRGCGGFSQPLGMVCTNQDGSLFSLANLYISYTSACKPYQLFLGIKCSTKIYF